MKKFINAPENFVDETLEGIVLAHPDQLKLHETNKRVVLRTEEKEAGKVAIVTGGGSGQWQMDAQSVMFLLHLQLRQWQMQSERVTAELALSVCSATMAAIR